MSYNGHRNYTVVIPDEDDVNDSDISSLEQGLRDLHHARNALYNIPLIDLTQVEEEQNAVLHYEIQIIDKIDGHRNSDCRSATLLRNRPIPLHLRFPSIRHNGTLIKVGTVVEVSKGPQEEFSWQFLHVSDIYIEALSHKPMLRGIRLTRQRYMRGLLPKVKNELCALYDIDREDLRDENVQAAVDVLVEQVIRTRALARTNNAFPKHRYDRSQWENNDEIENKAILVQRWKYYKYWANTTPNQKSYKGAVVRLRASDVQDANFRICDEKLRNEFRSGVIQGGSFKGGQAYSPTIDLDGSKANSNDDNTTVQYGRKYTADDMFCGAGGASCGIRQAGFQIRLACDLDTAACNSFRANFPEAILRRKNIFDLIKELEDSTDHSDLLHISPPCQVWSPAHTHPGKNDDANVAALFACSEILKRRRPRISTGEQTFGLLFDRNEQFFNSLVGQYTALGYSFSWDILRFKEYGVPSTRRRLIWIASCPGEALPPFPKPTHGRTGLPAPVTLRDVFRTIRPRDSLHDAADMLSRAKNSHKFPKKSYDDRTQIGTVTTAGSEWGHPSGMRNFTLRELAVIQGFPKKHEFLGSRTEISRQIGNAFPPVVVETLYGHLRKWLLRQDRAVTTRAAKQRQDVIMIDDETVLASEQDVIMIEEDEALVLSQPLNPREAIVISDNNDENLLNHHQGAPTARLIIAGDGVENAIILDDSGDIIMVDVGETDNPSRPFSRESSRTLSAESLHTHISIESDEEYDAETGRVSRMYMERQRETIRAHCRAVYHPN